ncbi:alpha/beta hydrolase [Amycolatopsis suaedae]|uniref:Alpha/beta hydrolase n=1 Tax=Amycolatopsis suaedae TaxID=2510978 RepID=A0A4Q7J3K6_9PSEU|nr:alpha/beta hydrolase [Amycolatopsis suaedae]
MLATLVPAILAGCTVGPSTRPPVVEKDGPPPQVKPSAPPPAPLPELVEPTDPRVSWSPCDPDLLTRMEPPAVPAGMQLSCGRVTTTLDSPEQPGRGVARVSVLKAGTGPIPLVVVNDIDSEPGTLYAARLAAALPPELLQRFSLVGVDRRGSGQSDPINCIPHDVRMQLIGFDPGAESVEPLVDSARRAGQQCAVTEENDLVAYDSWRAAGDLEEIREQLGVPHLHALARGEGTRVLATYAARFTDRVGRFVYDGAPDPSTDVATALEGAATGAKAALDAFGADCAARGCPLGADAAGAVGGLLETLRGAPLVTSDGTILGPGLAMYAVTSGLAQRARWTELGNALVAARSGDGGPLAAFALPLTSDTHGRRSRLDSWVATKCNDSMARLSPTQIDDMVRALRARQPLFAGFAAQQLAWCSPWPVRRDPLPPATVPGLPPMLLASTAADPMTPEQGTVRAADQMPTAVRVSWLGAGHGAVAASPCVAETVRAFLMDGKVPSENTLCPA